MRRWLMIILLTLVLGYLAITLAVFVFQRALIFPAPKDAREPRAGLMRGEGFIAFQRPGAPTIVHLHGNAEQLADSEWLAERYAERGFGYYAIEYPGYGLAAGTPVSEQAIYTAVEAGLIALEKTVPKDQLILEGQSLGSGVAVEMARRGHGSKLVLISAFTSMPDVAAKVVPFFPTHALVRDQFNSAQKAKDVTIPVLLIHGIDDELVPSNMGQTLSTLFPNATLMLVPKAHHNDLIDRPEVLEAIARFVRPLTPMP